MGSDSFSRSRSWREVSALYRAVVLKSKTPDARLFSVGGSGELLSPYHVLVALSNELEKAVARPRLETYRRIAADDATACALD